MSDPKPTPEELAQRKEFLKAEAKLRADYRATFSSAAGERVLQDLMRSHYMYGTTFDSVNRDEVLLREGQRSVVMRIIDLMHNTDPQKMLKLLEEGI